MEAVQVLVVEDDDAISEPLATGLRREGFEVTLVRTAAAALSAAPADLVLLDLGLPDADGFDVCKELRARSSAPIIIVTARDDESYRVAGLELGADDYVVKPFGFRELVARIRAVIRRSASPPPLQEPQRIGELEIDRRSHRAFLAAEEVSLTPKEFDLLALLAQDPGAMVTRPRSWQRFGTPIGTAHQRPWTSTSRQFARSSATLPGSRQAEVSVSASVFPSEGTPSELTIAIGPGLVDPGFRLVDSRRQCGRTKMSSEQGHDNRDPVRYEDDAGENVRCPCTPNSTSRKPSAPPRRRQSARSALASLDAVRHLRAHRPCGSSASSQRASFGQTSTASSATSNRYSGTGPSLTIGKPQSSSLISSGSISAHTPFPSQAIRSTRIRTDRLTGTLPTRQALLAARTPPCTSRSDARPPPLQTRSRRS